MSRTVIAAVVAVVIAALTAIAFFITSSSFEQKQRNDADAQLGRAYQVVQQLAQLEGIDVSNKAERLAAEPAFLAAIRTANATERGMQAQKGFLLFNGDDKQQGSGPKPSDIALLDTKGEIIAMNDSPNIVAKQWLADNGASILPAVNLVLALPPAAETVPDDKRAKKRRIIVSDIWNNKGVLMKVGVAPVIDPDAVPTAKDADGVVIVGAIVVAYAQTSSEAQSDRGLLGTEIAYYDAKKVVASSFTKGNSTDEDTARAQQLTAQLGSINETAAKQKISVDGVDYLAAAVKMPRKSTKPLGAEYPQVTAGAVVLAPITPSSSAFTIKLFILMLGIGALAIATLGLYLSHRRLIAQVDQVEQGVTDIINGNVDRTFRPVGPELDGLANALNVMLARLLGRPEPGEEEFDEEGNPIVQGRVEFEEGDEQPSRTDPELAALAQESEPDYYKRVYTEYLSARKASGNPDEVSFENFIAKLKVNEGKLKAQYQCARVRFRIVAKDNKVSLKPVPIFA